MQEAPKRVADDLRRRGSLRSSTLQELPPQLGVKANRLNARRRGAQRRTSALGTPRDQPIDVVASFGLSSEGLDIRVGDRLTGAGVTVDARFGHGSRSFLNFARIGIAWIASCVSSTVIRTTTSKRLPARSGPMTRLMYYEKMAGHDAHLVGTPPRPHR
jgi:hypothetical protein